MRGPSSSRSQCSAFPGVWLESSGRRRTVLVLAPVRFCGSVVFLAAENLLQPAPEGVPLIGSRLLSRRILRVHLDGILRAVLRLPADLRELGVHPALVAVAELG